MIEVTIVAGFAAVGAFTTGLALGDYWIRQLTGGDR